MCVYIYIYTHTHTRVFNTSRLRDSYVSQTHQHIDTLIKQKAEEESQESVPAQKNPAAARRRRRAAGKT